MSYDYNYKALWLYYKIKAFTMMLSCSVILGKEHPYDLHPLWVHQPPPDISELP